MCYVLCDMCYYIMKKILKIKNKILIAVAIISFLFPLFNVSLVKAQQDGGVNKLSNPIGGIFNPEGTEEAKASAREGKTDINSTIKKVIDTALGVLGSVTLLVFVIGGLMWLTSGGNEQRVDKGTKTMLYATIGVFVIFSAYAILSALIGVLSGS